MMNRRILLIEELNSIHNVLTSYFLKFKRNMISVDVVQRTILHNISCDSRFESTE